MSLTCLSHSSPASSVSHIRSLTTMAISARPKSEHAPSFRSTIEPDPATEVDNRTPVASSKSIYHQPRIRNKFILCFDGTGNKFHGPAADSNILKIYRMLDRNDPSQFHYYQPGIGTYVSTSSLSHTSTYRRIKSWYIKGKDSAIGTSFAEHVMGGYKVTSSTSTFPFSIVLTYNLGASF